MQAASKSNRLKIQWVTLSLVLLSACSSQRQHQGVEDGQIYLNAPALKALQVPSGMQLPPESTAYQFPQHPIEGARGPQLDLRPQPQLLALLPGSQAYFQQQQAILRLESSVKPAELWAQLNQWLSKQSIAVIKRDNKGQVLTTDWIEWPSNDKQPPYAGRYRLTLQQHNGSLQLMTQLLSLRQGQTLYPASSPLYLRYTAQFFNQIGTALEQQRSHSENQ